MMDTTMPTHVGIIMDGNRRFAKTLMQLPWKGHKYGAKKAREVLEWACEKGIKYLTAYTLSLENLRTRPRDELRMILNLLGQEADAMVNDATHVVHRFDVRVRFIGRLTQLPKKLQDKMHDVEKFTGKYKKHFLNIAVAYGGQQEIVDATKKILNETLKGVLRPSDLNETVVRKHLYTNGQPAPDLIIRTGGEKRLSNFMPFQSAYSELIFLDKRWPAFSKKDFEGCLAEFADRQRRFGA
ncbi:MAG: polyprenyl diphosphate synthase [Candidatus Aenigmatarchaeota archaeon]